MEQAIFLKKEHQQVKKELDFDFCGFSKTLPYHSFGPAIRQDYVLHVVMEGKGTYHVKEQQYHLKKGDLFLIRPGDSTFYLADGDDPWMYCWLSFNGPLAQKIIQRSLFKEDQYTMVSSGISAYIDIILECMHHSQEDLVNELELTALTYRFLSLLLKDGGKVGLGEQKVYSSLVIETVKYIEGHYPHHLTVEEIAQQLSINRSHLSRVFKNQLGTSIKEYLIGVRINRAAFLLSLTNDSVESIAYQVGFNSLVVFSRMFKKTTGETATSYRKRMKNEESRNLSLDTLKKELAEQAIISWST
ncbi:AraC family ligand binding domain-containing protein [Enterococcus villorum]|jgi:AraC family transcriptional regulator of arabinose operon|uniref:AraC family transcriptional regulator n=2 Tax=Enterococcus villorum TaxID=112904 RepID=A0A511J1W3_9ENTE|nr:AraC family transcriptional regulator [Enterococcus villorum]EOH92668.1 AraC-like ligand binding domain-containing protein [Enterococcus villorum ATCC 700913]EOW75576.1 AraC-like ligand binding domain-containing protein [Enterococcus villorum ATCC 700913]GEL92000.1 AraC family transcriptional regulator [Enterococcus villorum]